MFGIEYQNCVHFFVWHNLSLQLWKNLFGHFSEKYAWFLSNSNWFMSYVINRNLPIVSSAPWWCLFHYSDIIMSAMASQFTSLTIVYSTIYSGGDRRRHQSSASLTFVEGIHRWPVNSPHKWPVMRKISPFDDVIILCHHTHATAIATHERWHWLVKYVSCNFSKPQDILYWHAS